MKILDRVKTIPSIAYVGGFAGIFLISLMWVFFSVSDATLLEKKIRAKQKEYAEVLQLKNMYDMKKRAFDKAAAKKTEHRGLSLTVVEEMVSKSFTGGKLASLRPVTNKEEKGAQRMMVEVKLSNVPLKEVISFIKAADTFGLYVGRLRLSLPTTGSALDVQATVMESAPMVRKKTILTCAAGCAWGLIVMMLIVYFFFPYQQATRMALQSVVAGGRAAVSMEGVTMRIMGINASKILFRPDSASGQTAPFELTGIRILWNPLSLARGTLTIYSKARVYGGKLNCTIADIPIMSRSNPNVTVKLERVDISRCPDGVLPWFKGMTGTLEGVIRKRVPVNKPETQVGSFRFVMRNGEVRDLQVKNMPRLIIPYREIVVEGKMAGQKIDVTKLSLVATSSP
jgi:hypothetical protein